jgi:hypothetical protein
LLDDLDRCSGRWRFGERSPVFSSTIINWNVTSILTMHVVIVYNRPKRVCFDCPVHYIKR